MTRTPAHIPDGSAREARHGQGQTPFAAVPEAATLRQFSSRSDTPTVLRAAAAAWPAVHRWSFAHLCDACDEQEVTLVVGNREAGATRLVKAPLQACLARLAQGLPLWGDGSQPAHLKEFDLLGAAPRLRRDAPAAALCPKGHVVFSSAWLGSTGAHTGLHYGYLDNRATLIRGAKRFFLVRPGVVERIGAVSSKYDRYARLAATDIQALSRLSLPQGDLLSVDLYAGDAIHVPRGWWHEVVNLQPSILLSGFHCPWWTLGPRWLCNAARHLAHRLSPVRPRNCTCHPHAPPAPCAHPRLRDPGHTPWPERPAE